MLKGSKKAVEKTAQLLQVLDPTPTTVTVDVEIRVNDPENDGGQKILDQLQLSGLDNKSASLQFAQEVAVVTGRVTLGSRGSQVQTQRTQTGTLVKVTPRVAGGGVMLELNVEKSWIEYPATKTEDNEDADALQTPTTYTLVLDTTLQLDAGKSQTIKSKVSGGASVREAEITVSARTGAATNRSSDAVREGTPSRGGRGAGSSNPSRGSGAASRGGFGGGRGGGSPPSGRSGGRGGFSTPSQEDGRAEQIAGVVFGRIDSDGNGEVDKSERDSNSRMLEAMGLESSDEVTVENLKKAIQARTGRSRQSSESKDKDAEPKDAADKD